MMPATALRRIAPTHNDWTPHGYQQRAIEHLCARGSAALFLDPGMGKTAVTLAAFCELQDAGIANSMLVIAPMRVCQLVWRQEAQKWTQFRHLRFAMMAGKDADERKKLLRADADIWLLNPESVPWLCDQFFMQRLPFDTVTVDELTKFKNGRALRSKKLQPLMDKTPRRWGLTGTPVPNGYMDLFGQMRLIDGGAALGKYITHFRDRFFQPGRDGFSYDLRPNAAKQIEAAIEPYVFRADAEDYLTLPPLSTRRIELELPKPIRAKYKEMKRDMIVSLEGKTITAANSAAVYNKLQQFAGGAMYTGAPVSSGQYNYVKVHDLKLDALDDLIEELAGQPLLVAYAYGHELERILERHPGTPYLGGGVSGKRAEEIEREWNAGKYPVLLCHPASAGHGLNMQLGGAGHLCWFTQTWDYELYDQFIRRIHRQGNSAERIVMHKIMVLDTIDELVEDALNGKETTQDALLAALKSEIIRDDPNAKVAFDTTVGANMRKLSSPGTPQNTAAPAPAQQTQAAPAQGVKGWGNAAPRAAAAPQPAAAPPAAQPAPAAAPVKGWGNTAFATKPAPQPAPVEQAPPEAQQFEQEADAQFGDTTQGLLPEGALHPSQTAGEGAPFDGGQPALLAAPPAQSKTRAPRASRSASKDTSADLAHGETAQRVLLDAQTFANRNVNYSVDVSAMLKAMLEVGTPLETALEAIANLTDHMDGKE